MGKAAAVLMVLLSVKSLFAQVHLRDTVSISPKKEFGVEDAGTLVAPKSGILIIWPYEVDELSESPIPEGASVIVSVNNTVKRELKVLSYFKDGAYSYTGQSNYYNRCTNQYFTLTESVYMNLVHNYSDPPDSVFTI